MTGVARADQLFGPVAVDMEVRADGARVMRCGHPLGAYSPTVCHYLERWAGDAPERAFLAARAAQGAWRTLTYAEARRSVRCIAAALLTRGLDQESTIMLLSDNSIENAQLQLGALYAGVPVAPISPAYSLMSKDHGKLRYIADQLKPAVVFAQNGEQFAGALAAIADQDCEIVHVDSAVDDGATEFAELLARADEELVTRSLKALDPDAPAKILFTSGSTGQPKGVINTHRMMCSNQQAIAQMWPFLERRPPVLVDWLPWNHTFGGNHDMNMILRNGGTLYIDGGKPAPGLIDRTVENLRSVSPTLYFNVPRGFDMILPVLEADEAFRDHFFANLDLIFYAAAALPQNLWDRLEKLSTAARGTAVTMTTAWGSTETSPLATSAHYPLERAGIVGVPAPGTEIKLLPNGNKLELLVKGPNVTPGYFRRDDLTAEAFDEEGFYRIGDAGRFADPDDPARGLVFDGRVAEDFKLLTGTWVSAGEVRIATIAACSPLIQDAVVTGHDRDDVGLLVFLHPGACSQAAGKPADTPLAALIGDDTVGVMLRDGLGAYNAANPASSTCIRRILLLDEPPSIDANEITDKGYINQRAVLERRADAVERLYAGDAADDIIVFD
jgi:feruloyl-CoA synthase